MEEEKRAVPGLAWTMPSSQEPSFTVNLAPGTHGGPVRHIGVMNPVHLYLGLEAWCTSQDTPPYAFFPNTSACLGQDGLCPSS